MGGLELLLISSDAVVVAPLPPSGSLVLGRDESCDVRIAERSVSRRHAVLHLGPSLSIQDLGSANGTFVRDAHSPGDSAGTQPLRRLSRSSIEIHVGERVNLATSTIVVRRAEVAPAPGENQVIVRDPVMLDLYAQAARAAASDISVLLLGETGVGKEVLARTIKARSARAAGPYVELSCAALPPSLLESELFGHERHAFTGAAEARPGLLESAHGGTVFLDEIGELPAAVQVKLLRVLEDRKILRIGARTPRRLDVRFLAATNRDLRAEIDAGTFRADLFYRLNGLSLVIPPLRQRRLEIAPLAERFLAEACRQLERRAPIAISPPVLEHLERYPWPGNVRELKNVMERAAVLCVDDVLEPADLPALLTGVCGPAPAASLGETPPPLGKDQGPGAATERLRIVRALDDCAGNQTRAAKLLGMSLRTLVTRLGEYQLPRPRKR